MCLPRAAATAWHVALSNTSRLGAVRKRPLGLPADFLIAPSGRINAVKYGTDAYDQWSVDELLTLAKGVAAQAL